MSIIITILAIAVMILIHEWGHFIAGRICKTLISEFSLGMGPAIFQKKGKKETTFSIRAIPLGGYCAFDEATTEEGEEPKESSFQKLPVIKRLFIFIMGPLMNFVLAFIVFISMVLFVGIPTTSTVIESSKANSTVEIMSNDEIIAVNNVDVTGSYNNMINEFAKAIKEDYTKTIPVTILRNGEKITTTITPQYDETTDKCSIGITTKYIYEKQNVLSSMKYGAVLTVNSASMVVESLAGLITGKYAASEMLGIIGVVDIMSEHANADSVFTFLQLMGVISVNLGLMNLLPIPGLDGSKILFGIIEAVRRKPIPQEVEVKLTVAGFVLLIGLFVFATFNDITRIFS